MTANSAATERKLLLLEEGKESRKEIFFKSVLEGTEEYGEKSRRPVSRGRSAPAHLRNFQRIQKNEINKFVSSCSFPRATEAHIQ